MISSPQAEPVVRHPHRSRLDHAAAAASVEPRIRRGRADIADSAAEASGAGLGSGADAPTISVISVDAITMLPSIPRRPPAHLHQAGWMSTAATSTLNDFVDLDSAFRYVCAINVLICMLLILWLNCVRAICACGV